MAGYDGRQGFDADPKKSVNGTAYNSQSITQRSSRTDANTAQGQPRDLGVYATSNIFSANGFDPQSIMSQAESSFLVQGINPNQNPDFRSGFAANKFLDPVNGQDNIKGIIQSSTLEDDKDDKPFLGVGPNLVIQNPDEVSDGDINVNVMQLGDRNNRGRGFGWTNSQGGEALGDYFQRSYSMTDRPENETEAVVKGERIPETPVDYDQ